MLVFLLRCSEQFFVVVHSKKKYGPASDGLPVDVCHCISTAKFQALVYNILPQTTAIVDYAVGLKNKKAQIAVSL